MPATGEGISLLTLSVETSKSGSSRATESPTFLNHWTTVALTMLSPNFGKAIFTISLISSSIIYFLIDFFNQLLPLCLITPDFHLHFQIINGQIGSRQFHKILFRTH